VQQFAVIVQYNNAQKFGTPLQYNNTLQCVAPPQYNSAKPQYNQAPQYNKPCGDNQGNKGGFIRGGFGGVRGPVVCHNYHKPKHYARDYP